MFARLVANALRNRLLVIAIAVGLYNYVRTITGSPFTVDVGGRRQQDVDPGVRPARRGGVDAEAVRDLGVVLHAPPHPGSIQLHRDSMGSEVLRPADSRAHQQRRTGVRPEAGDRRVGLEDQ